MANTKIKATAQLFLDTSHAKSDAKQFVADLKQQLSSIETAADKMTVFKDLVGYIGQVDSALSALRAKHGDAFAHMFDGLDENFRAEFEKLFGLSGESLGQFKVLREQFESLTPKSSIKDVRKFATELDKLFTSIGASSNIDLESFTGRVNQGHLDTLTDALKRFEVQWSRTIAKFKDGFDFGDGSDGISSGIHQTSEDVQKELDNLEQQINRLGEIQKILLKASADVQKYNMDGSIFSKETTFTIEEVTSAIKEFGRAQKDFKNFDGDKNSIEYFKVLSNYVQQATKISSMYSFATDTNNDYSKQLYKELQEKNLKSGKGTYADSLKQASQTAEKVLSGGITKSLLQQTTSVSTQIDNINERMITLEDKLENMNPVTENIGTGFAKITQEVDRSSKAIQKVMYHLGNLLNGANEVRDTFGDMAYNLTDAASDSPKYKEYGYGVLGGGLFGVSDPSTIDSQTVAGGKFVQTIDLSKYNMYIADTEERATNLIDFLSKFQKYAFKTAEPNYTGFDKQLANINIDTLYDRFKIVFDESDLTKEKFNNFFDEMVTLLRKAGLKFDSEAGELEFDSIGDLENTENISTRFLKMLGYQGVNVGGTSFDGMGQGSVLFDFNTSDIVGYFNTIDQAMTDFQNRLKNTSWDGTNEQLIQYKNSISDIIARLQEYKSRWKDVNTVAQFDTTIERLSQVQTNIESVLSGKSLGGGDGFKQITAAVQQAGEAAQEASTKLKELQNTEVSKDNSQQIEDTLSARKQEEAVVEQTSQKLQDQLQIQKQIKAESSASVDETKASNSKTDVFEEEGRKTIAAVQAETAQLQELLGIINKVKDAVDAKTAAFKEETAAVDQAVGQEVASLNRLKSSLEEIQEILKFVFATNGQNLGNINIGQDKINDSGMSDVLTGIHKTLGQVLSVIEASNGVESDNKNSVKYQKPIVDNSSNTDASDAIKLLAGKLSGDIATEGTLKSIKGSVDKLATQQQTNSKKPNSDKYALEQTLQGAARSLGEINGKLGGAGVIPNLVNSLRSVVTTLQAIAQGITPNNNKNNNQSPAPGSGSNNQKQTLTIGEQSKQAYDTLANSAIDASVQVKRTGDQVVETEQKVGAEVAKIVETTKDGITSTTLTMANANKIAMDKVKKQFEEFDTSKYFGVAPKIGASPEAQDLYGQYIATYNKLKIAMQDYDNAMKAGIDTTKIQQNINGLQGELSGLEKQLIAIANKSKSFLDGGALFAHLDGNGIKDSANSLKQLVVTTESLAVAFRGVHDDGRKVIYDVLDNGIIKSYAVEVDEATGNVRKMELSEYGLVNAMQNVNKVARQREDLNGVFDPNNDNVNKNATVIKNYLQAKNDLDVAVKDAWDKAQQNGGIMDKSDLDAIYTMSQEVIRLGSVIQSEYKKISNIKDTGGIFGKLGGDINDGVEARMRKYVSDYAKLGTQSVANIQYDSAAKTMTADLIGLSGEITKVRMQYNEMFDGVQTTSMKGTQAIDDISQKMKTLSTSISGAVADGFIDKNLSKYKKYEHAVSSLADHIQQIQNGNIAFDDAAISKWEFLRNVIVQTGEELLNIANINKSNNQNADNIFKSDKTKAENNFTKYNESVKDAAYLTQNLKDELSALESLLKNISNSSDLSIWNDDFKEIQEKIARSKEDFELRGKGSANTLRGQLNGINFKQLGVDVNSQKLTTDQENIVNKYKAIQIEIEKYANAVKRGEQVSTQAIQNNIDALMQEIAAYKQKNNIVDSGTKTKQAYGAMSAITATAKHNTLKDRAKGYMDNGSTVVSDAMAKYEAAYQRLIALQNKFKNASANDDQKAQFVQLRDECNKYGNDLKKILDLSDKLNANAVHSQSIDDTIDVNSKTGRADALKEYVESVYGARVQIQGFNGDCTELSFAVKNADGTVENMTASFDAARTSIISLSNGTKKASGAFGEFSGVFKEIGRFAASRLGIDDIVRALRSGFNAVKEIDTALTELKKVTDESEASYRKFLDTASQHAGKIGSTVSDYTTATSNFARLGYDMDTSSKMAESAIVYKNVADGIDNVEQATDSIISTMKAFGIESDNTMSIVDKFNEVGNNFAITSAGIGEAFQRSASALYESGNTIDESIALVTAANSV